MIVFKKRTPRVKNPTDYTNRRRQNGMFHDGNLFKKEDIAKRASQQFIRVWFKQKERPAETIRRRTYVV